MPGKSIMMIMNLHSEEGEERLVLQCPSLFFDESLFKCLRDVDHEVAHLLQLAYNIHIVDAGLIVLSVALNALDFSIPEIVPEVVDAVLSIVCI